MYNPYIIRHIGYNVNFPIPGLLTKTYCIPPPPAHTDGYYTVMYIH